MIRAEIMMKIDIGQYVRNTSSLRPERLRLQRTRACDVTCITSIPRILHHKMMVSTCAYMTDGARVPA